MEAHHTVALNALRMLSRNMNNQTDSHQLKQIDGVIPVAYTLFEKVMSFTPDDPTWLNQDRLVLSSCYIKSLLGGLLYFNHFSISLDDLKSFTFSKVTKIVEGISNENLSGAVQAALQEQKLEEKFNRPQFQVINHFTYALLDIKELENTACLSAIRLAGEQCLKKLVLIMMANAGESPLAAIQPLFKEAGWEIKRVNCGDLTLHQIQVMIEQARLSERPVVLIFENEQEFSIRQTEWPYAPFVFPEQVYANFDQAVDQKGSRHLRWKQLMDHYRLAYPLEYYELNHQNLNGLN